MKQLNVEQMVLRCFCPYKKRESLKQSFSYKLWNLVRSKQDVLYLARAARKFVRMENKTKR
jgi:hypothetical protein